MKYTVSFLSIFLFYGLLYAEKIITSIPENVKLIVGITDDKAYLPRVQAIHALGKKLPQDQIDAFYDFLFQKLEN